MADRIVGEREDDEARAAQACCVNRGADFVPSFPAPQRGGIAADGGFVLTVVERDGHARGGDRHHTNR